MVSALKVCIGLVPSQILLLYLCLKVLNKHLPVRSLSLLKLPWVAFFFSFLDMVGWKDKVASCIFEGLSGTVQRGKTRGSKDT